MKKWIPTLSFIILTAISLLLVLRGQSMKGGEPTSPSKVSIPTDNRSTTAVPRSPSEVIFPKPKIFRSKTYPPQTAEEKAMWSWWRQMRKDDPSFEWKTPIEFYGRVVDQFKMPVAGATVRISWAAAEGTKTRDLLSESDGSFSLTGVRGKSATIDVSKDGYTAAGGDSRKGFEFAAFFQEDFYDPNVGRPVIFQLHKITNAQPLFVFYAHGVLVANQRPLWLNLSSGKAGDEGDVSINLLVSSNNNTSERDYTVRIESREGGGIILTREKYTDIAPESDYLESLVMSATRKGTENNNDFKTTFYAKTNSARYAVVSVEVSINPGSDTAELSATVTYNPSGSRSLEFDPKKMLNP